MCSLFSYIYVYRLHFFMIYANAYSTSLIPVVTSHICHIFVHQILYNIILFVWEEGEKLAFLVFV